MRRSKKRTNLSHRRKTREVKFVIDVRTYDQLSYMAGPESMVGKFEDMVGEAFAQEIKSMGLKYPRYSVSPC